MSDGPPAATTARRVGSGTSRLVRAWRVLPHESRLAAFASLALFLTLFLPWYQVTLIAPAQSAKLQSASATITGWGAFSFVEAAVLLVAASVLTLLFQRAEGRAFHLPGGDGGVITAAGVWTCVLIVWRIFDKQGATTKGPAATSSGIEWGIFFALAAGAFLAYSGSRIRAAHRPEPPLPGEDHAPAGSNAAVDTTTEPRRPRDRSSEPRRRARSPRPVSADRTAARARRPRAAVPDRATVAPDRTAVAPDRATFAPDRATDAPPNRPRHRPTADELFERVVPEDPPAMRFGRIPPSNRPSFMPPSHDDETLALGADETLRLGADETLPFGADETLPFGADETLPLGADETVRLGQDDTMHLGEDETLPMRRRPEH
ncbi:MAG TPA: hypothetical protein VMA77_03980 [Solirubrobacteraceae bacterium]|nr:hypothetical protein [Solirubrobacteraceae bacterium]